jgi:hypothetical protein
LLGLPRFVHGRTVGEWGTVYVGNRCFVGRFLVLPDRIELSTSPLPRERASIQTGRVGGQSCIGCPPESRSIISADSRTRTGLRLCERNKFVWIDSGSGITITAGFPGGRTRRARFPASGSTFIHLPLPVHRCVRTMSFLCAYPDKCCTPITTVFCLFKPTGRLATSS